LTVKDDHGAILLSVGPLKDGRLRKPMDPSLSSDILSGSGQTSYHADTGSISLYAGRLAEERYLFGAAYEIDPSVGSSATDLQPTMVGGQPAVGLKCKIGESSLSTTAVVIFHTATSTMWFTLTADNAHFRKAWTALISSMKVAKTVPLEAGTDLKAFTHDTKNYPTCTAP